MPYIYRSTGLQESARRGRRAIMSHPDWRNSVTRQTIPWETLATDMIADILHGVNSRADMENPQNTLRRALSTWEGDFDEEQNY